MGLDILFKWAIFDLERFDTFGQEPGFKYGPDSKNTCKLVNCSSTVFFIVPSSGHQCYLHL